MLRTPSLSNCCAMQADDACDSPALASALPEHLRKRLEKRANTMRSGSCKENGVEVCKENGAEVNEAAEASQRAPAAASPTARIAGGASICQHNRERSA